MCLSIAVPQHLGGAGYRDKRIWHFSHPDRKTNKTKNNQVQGTWQRVTQQETQCHLCPLPVCKGTPSSPHTVKGCSSVSEDLSSVHNACVPATAHRKQKANNSYSGLHAYICLYPSHILKLLVPYCSLSDFNNNNFDIHDQLPLSCTVRGERDLATQRARGSFFGSFHSWNPAPASLP